MLKIIGIILAVIIIVRIVIGPVHNYINNLIQVNKTESEEQFIGLVTRHNPRVEEIQQILKDADFNLGLIDGMMGAQTRGAIKEFQKANQLKPTGKIDPATWTALNREKEVLQHEQKIGVSAEVVKKTEPHVVIIGHRLKTKDRIKQAQIALKKAGFYQGEIDSKIGPKTKKAIIDFQRSKKLKPDGVVGLKTWEELIKYLRD
ncbi:MAG: peptidoglycan-binding protein [Candidatus Omnitrophica bacterium]|nr:peptidoglycan-binding protein [Candidatus Omnitrophota bacterium]MCG2714167.1 peptidoglycan-binding protein [Candidatus Omnitrophota bacterium]